MFMNIFRITGDVCHLLSFVVMFWKLHTSRSVAGAGRPLTRMLAPTLAAALAPALSPALAPALARVPSPNPAPAADPSPRARTLQASRFRRAKLSHP